MKNSEIFDKARELGELIKNSEAKKRAEETSERLAADKEASALIDRYNSIREQKYEELTKGQPTPEDAKNANEYIQAEFEKIAGNPVIKDYLEAAREYEMLLSQMDSILKHFIVGEQEQGCSGSCEGCSGCR
ncbi:MAG TPA: YlbF family regulator [Candidatus Monoglobus merdigallinarum]|uniref:YlbF family regulator n=1 Tax=Candidatus Monoglobus merdigallinarum TaxID=2838698 RepID=A0A9D1TL76_9FIRM|nr:YlbF family regulator [Candidatus Monoglobus merdigallinarum]